MLNNQFLPLLWNAIVIKNILFSPPALAQVSEMDYKVFIRPSHASARPSARVVDDVAPKPQDRFAPSQVLRKRLGP